MTYDQKVLDATQEEKAAAFEWLRATALAGGKDWRKAAIALEELVRLNAPRPEAVSLWRQMFEQEPPDPRSYARSKGYIVVNAGNVQPAWWYGDRWQDGGGFDITKQVTHWQPFPDAPSVPGPQVER